MYYANIKANNNLLSRFSNSYIVPLSIIVYLYVKSSQELKSQEIPLTLAIFKARSKNLTFRKRHGSNTSNNTS